LIVSPPSDYSCQVNKLRAQGTADIVLIGGDCVESENEAARVAQLKGASYISPYNDFQVVVPECILHQYLQ
jgi:threonine dehydratase